MYFIVIAFKTIFMSMLAIAIRGTLPRYRFDQLTQMNWKHFIFIWIGFSIFNTGFLLLFL